MILDFHPFSGSCFTATHPSRWHHVPPLIPARTAPPSFEAKTQQTCHPWRWVVFRGSTTNTATSSAPLARHPCPRHDLLCHFLAPVRVSSVTTTTSHPASLVPQSSPNTRPLLLPVHWNKSVWPSPLSSTTNHVLHNYTTGRQTWLHNTYILVSPRLNLRHYPLTITHHHTEPQWTNQTCVCK